MGEAFRSHTFFALDPAGIAAKLMDLAPESDAEALRMLRARFPESPLSLRVAALDFLMRRRPGEFGRR